MKFHSPLSSLKNFFRKLYLGRKLENEDFIIPYEIDDSLASYFSHEDFSGLFFNCEPYENDVWRAFSNTLMKCQGNQIKFIDGLLLQAKAHKKLDFLYWVKDQMSMKVDSETYYTKEQIAIINSVKEHVARRIEAIVQNDQRFICPYDWSDDRGAIQNLVEVGIQIAKSELNLRKKLNEKEEKAFVIWFGRVFGLDITTSYPTVHQRIKDEKKLEDFQGYKFAIAMVKSRESKEGEVEPRSKTRKK